MALRNLLQAFKEKKELSSLKNVAVNRSNYSFMPGVERPVMIPQKVRGAYMEVFEDLAKSNSIHHGADLPWFGGASRGSHEEKSNIPFYAIDKDRGANMILEFRPDSVNLDVHSAFYQGDINAFETEAGRISTFYDISHDEIIKTSLVGYNDNFEYNGGMGANHVISKSIDKIYEHPDIPIEKEELDKIPEIWRGRTRLDVPYSGSSGGG